MNKENFILAITTAFVAVLLFIFCSGLSEKNTEIAKAFVEYYTNK